MTTELLGERTKRVIKGANISPRILAAVTKIHFTTIYATMRNSKQESIAYPITVDTLTKALDSIEKLINEGTLPFEDALSHDARIEALKALLDKSN